MNKIILVVTSLLLTSVAQAQTHQSFNDIGQPTGTAQQFPNGQTQYYNSIGQPTGTSQTYSNGTTQFYGDTGQPTGTVNSYPSAGGASGGNAGYTQEQMNRAFGVGRQ